MVVPAEEHGNTASGDVEASSLLLSHEQAPVSEAGFPIRFTRRRIGHKQKFPESKINKLFVLADVKKQELGLRMKMKMEMGEFK